MINELASNSNPNFATNCHCGRMTSVGNSMGTTHLQFTKLRMSKCAPLKPNFLSTRHENNMNSNMNVQNKKAKNV